MDCDSWGVGSIPLPDPPLGDDAVALEPFTQADIDPLAEICTDPAIARYTFIPAPYERRHAVDFVMNQDRRRSSGESIDLAIRDRRDRSLLGALGLRVFNLDRGSCEIGYWVAPAARGAGIAPRGVRLLAQWALRELPVRLIDLTADAPNRPSQRVAEKAGFTRTDEVRERFAKGRRWHLIVYSLEGGPTPSQ